MNMSESIWTSDMSFKEKSIDNNIMEIVFAYFKISCHKKWYKYTFQAQKS